MIYEYYFYKMEDKKIFEKGKVAAVMLINPNKQILMCLRDDKPDIPYPNTWGLIGGHLEGRETPIQALKREVKEEINIDIKDVKYLDKFDDGVGNVVYVFKSKIDKKSNEITLNEGQRLEFFDLNILIKQKVPLQFLQFINHNKKKIFDK